MRSESCKPCARKRRTWRREMTEQHVCTKVLVPEQRHPKTRHQGKWLCGHRKTWMEWGWLCGRRQAGSWHPRPTRGNAPPRIPAKVKHRPLATRPAATAAEWRGEQGCASRQSGSLLLMSYFASRSLNATACWLGHDLTGWITSAAASCFQSSFASLPSRVTLAIFSPASGLIRTGPFGTSRVIA